MGATQVGSAAEEEKVILSVAKDPMPIASGDEVLRSAQDDGNSDNLEGFFIVVIIILVVVLFVLLLLFLVFVVVIVVVAEGDPRHHAALSFLTIGRTFSADTIWVISLVM